MNQGTQIVCCRWGRFATQQQALAFWESGLGCTFRPVPNPVPPAVRCGPFMARSSFLFRIVKKQRAKPIRVRSVRDRNQSSTIIFKLLINICICSQYRPGSTGALSMDCQNRQLSCRGNPCIVATKVVDGKINEVL